MPLICSRAFHYIRQMKVRAALICLISNEACKGLKVYSTLVNVDAKLNMSGSKPSHHISPNGGWSQSLI